MPCLGILPRSLGGQKSLHIKLPLNIEAGVRVLFKPSTFSKVYLQNLVTTFVFLGLQTFHLARTPRKMTEATSHTYTVRHRYMYVATVLKLYRMHKY